MLEAFAIILVAINLLALVSGLLCRRWPVAGLGVPLAMWLLVQPAWWQIPRAVESWRSGGAALWVVGDTPEPDLPDPELRLRWVHFWGDLTSPTGAGLHNTTLRVLDRLIRPARGAWQGRVPTLAEATARLDAEGQDLSLKLRFDGALVARGGAESLVGRLADGAELEVYDPSDRPCGAGPEGVAQVRVARLDPEALLVRCGARTEIFTRPWPEGPYQRFWPLREVEGSTD